ncbi:capsular biosynthesis protein [Methylobacterium sp. W2]|uniref:capsular polysaccharide export protein, LipB/KpsS family n=1 Tax=Methylobacterium sp. W2 TaxID=2598107 RepID=UPI0039B5EBE4
MPSTPSPSAASIATRSLLAASRPIQALRAEIEAVTGLGFGRAWRPEAIGVVWGRGGLAASSLRLAGRAILAVEPGPLLSPYDSPATGLSTLRLTLDGIPFGGEAGIHAFDPWTRRPIPFEECRDKVAWLEGRFRDNHRPTVLVGISRWKRPALDVFVSGPSGKPVHAMNAEDAVAKARAGNARILAWATRMPERLPALCAEQGLPLARIEDGFLRSVGLGASLQPGASIVVDDSGIYYDPRTESRLARILKNEDFSPELLARAAALRRLVVERRLTKYNVGLAGDASGWPENRRIVLVPGQVEDDASVRHGSPHVRSNLELLRAARARNPRAFLLYKPHPDVEAGFRPGVIPEAEVQALADRVVAGLSIVDLLDRAHHVETMTSLAGFEALIRGLSVTVHGRPFYAGWGLTEDLAPGADRGRRLALDELVAGALLVYPLYLDPVAMKPCTPEQLLDRLSESREAAPPSKLALSRRAQIVMRLRYAVLNPIVRLIRARRGIGRGGDKA